jgi:hypothetical protein
MNQEDFANQQNSLITHLLGLQGSQYIPQMQKLLGEYFGLANQNLFGQEQRDMTGAGNQGLAAGLSMGLSNPSLLAQRGRSDVGQQYAGQFGNLARQYYGGLAQLPQQQFQNTLSLLGLQQGLGQYLPQPSNMGGMLGSLAGTALGSFAGPFGAAIGGKLGSSIGGGGGNTYSSFTPDAWSEVSP